ncbi:MAG TPA: Tol-Pal system beta propeller repeat protein TolB [Burkholderiales bacterium]|nr:Tol-Pal system beta propeller repeat protein TolB [Burkholderiales bacterium]
MARTLLRFLILAAIGASSAVSAQVTIEIVGTGSNQIPIAIAPFAGEEASQPTLTDIIEADLARSGRFNNLYVPPQNPSLSEANTPDYMSWKARGADALVLGSVNSAGGGRYATRFHLYDVPRQQWLDGRDFPAVAPAQLRAVAHRAADYIYEKFTGERGVFSTRIAFVTKTGRNFQLIVADSDGENRQVLSNSPEPIISPTWAPNGKSIAYVAFDSKKPVVYVHNLENNGRRAVANFTGSNSAPAWSPDGQRLAVALSKEGGTQLYMVNADGSGVRRLASSSAIDTEPVFSPDGQSIYFTSDRGGGPQIYRMPASGGPAQRVTQSGSYNVSPDISPDGKWLTYVARDSGRFQVALLELGTGQVQVLTDTAHDESPSFAPNGKMILYATESGGRGILAATSIDGRSKYRLSVPAGDVREPNWGPFPAN